MLKLFFKRFVLAFLLVLAIYNGTGISYFHWVAGPFEGFLSPVGFGKVLIGIGLFAAVMFFVWSTLRAAAKIVYGLIVPVTVGIVVWMALMGWINLEDPTLMTIVAQALIAAALALGSIWSHIWRQQTGQQTVEDFDTGDTV